MADLAMYGNRGIDEVLDPATFKGSTPSKMGEPATPEPKQVDKKPDITPGIDLAAEGAKAAGVIEKSADEQSNSLVDFNKKLMGLEKNLKNINIPAPPSKGSLPQAPNLRPQDPFASESNFGATILFASLAGAFTRAPLTVAMNSSAEYLKGFKQGDEERMKIARDNWKESMELALSQHKLELDHYKAAMESSKGNIDKLMAEMSVGAMVANNDKMASAVKSGAASEVFKIYEGAQKAHTEQERMMLLAGSGNSQARIDAIGSYRAPPISPGNRSPVNQAMMEEVYKQYPNYDATKYAVKAAETKVVGTADARALSGSLTKLVAQQSAITQFENTAIKNGRVLLDLADKVDATGMPAAERWIRAGRKATGDPDVATFNAQINLYRAEVAKILTNPTLAGVLTDTARKEASDFLSSSASAKQLKAVVKLLEQDFGRRKESLQEEISSVRSQLKGGQQPAAAQAAPTAADPLGIR